MPTKYVKIIFPLLVLCALLKIAGIARAQSPTCDFTYSSSFNEGQVGPGKTICVTSSTTALNLTGLTGSASQPIIIINKGGVVNLSGGIQIDHSKYFRLTGTGVSDKCGADVADTFDDTTLKSGQQCGFVVKGVSGHGIRIVDGTTNFELDHIELSGGDIGFSLGSRCPEFNPASFAQRDSSVHHTYVHDTGSEAYYLGHNDTFEVRSGAPNNCKNPQLKGFWVHHNLVMDFGKDGINVKGASERCEIYNNKIYRGSQNSPGQEGGITNPYSQCDVYNNYIQDNAAMGIRQNSGVGGTNRIYNNIIVRSGRDYSAGSDRGSGVVVNPAFTSGTQYVIANNTIIDSNSNGISADAGGNVKVANNAIINSSGTQIMGQSAQSNNLTFGSVTEAKLDATKYFPLDGSPVIDQGADLSSDGITSDFLGKARPAGNAFDVGAYESNSTGTPPTPTTTGTASPSFKFLLANYGSEFSGLLDDAFLNILDFLFKLKNP